MGINRVSACTDQFFHESSGCGGAVNLKPWIPRGADAASAAVFRRGVCDRCSKIFFDAGNQDVTDDDLEAGRPG